MAAEKKQTRPGGRTERNRQAVARAVLQLIGEGRLDFEVQEVAAIAGVHRTTLFRRWPDRGALIAEAMAEHVSRLSIELVGEWEQDLRLIAIALRDFLSEPVELAMNRMLAITDNEVFREQMFRHWLPITDAFRMPLADAQKAGILSREVDPTMVMTMLTSPILVYTVFMRTPPSDSYVARLVDQAIRGCV